MQMSSFYRKVFANIGIKKYENYIRWNVLDVFFVWIAGMTVSIASLEGIHLILHSNIYQPAFPHIPLIQ
jgi:hypothetical protein